MKRFGGKRTKPSPAMNVTPLVDIVLVLLIIFMVVLPNMENDAPVDLPSIFHVDEEPRGRVDPVTVSVTADERLFLEQDPMSAEDLEARLRGVPSWLLVITGSVLLAPAFVFPLEEHEWIPIFGGRSTPWRPFMTRASFWSRRGLST